MKLSTRARYGVRAMLDVAQHSSEGPVQLKQIAQRQEVSLKYLEQIFAQLKGVGFVRGIRGPRGGYVLAKPLDAINLAQVVEALDGPLSLVDCVDDENACDRAPNCPARRVWQDVSRALREKLSSFTLSQMRMPMSQGEPVLGRF